MNETVRPSRCATCKHWDRRFRENQSLGICKRMGVSEWPGRMHVSVTTNDDYKPGEHSGATNENFGCVLHSDYVFTQLDGTV